jgi:hypothetical protein
MDCKPCEDNNRNEQDFFNRIFAPVPEDMLFGKKSTDDAEDTANK